MTDTPGWASPGSPEPPRDGSRPPADAPAAVPGQSAPPHDAPTAWGTAPGAPQPPYGQQQPPYGQQPPFGPPPGGQYGGRQYGWGAPPSPKPGVIPLRPLGLGEILDGAVSTVRKHWRVALGLSLGVAVVQQGVALGAQLAIQGDTGELTPVLTSLVSLPLAWLLGVIASALLTMVVSRAILGQSVTLREAWRDARPRLLQLVGLTLLNGLILGGIALLACAPLIGYALAGAEEPAITALLAVVGLLSLPVICWLGIQLSLAAPALMLEKQGVIAALSRSRRLVRRSWWRIFGITLLSTVMAWIVSSVISTPFTVAGMVLGWGDLTSRIDSGDAATMPPAMLVAVAIGGILSSTITLPFTATIGVLLYVDQRIRREALDIELARAAGLPEQGGTGWDGQAGPAPARL
ncbi:glycerophosphoryl diester phosphodiesterase membrane domain-containing protein [Kitasatospora putterlickiae]|uniref:Glycerophosphoryl diester phosphodiesterase membrane domain-containing protein n=1 Tax=Kitasatospora putterlickiae TaxID=221725 RepID=A0ABN1XUU3_9ACTN